MRRHWAPGPTRQASIEHRNSMASLARISTPHESPKRANTNLYYRERSSSNRNLPDSNKLQVQPRRASDEVAASHHLMTRMSPASSRRSISVINVGDGQSGLLNRQTRFSSQSGSLKSQLRRDSTSQQMQMAKKAATSESPKSTKYASPSGSVSRTSEALVCTTASGRRSSLVGVQSMVGYRSQKNSQSDATDHESPLNSVAQNRTREPTPAQQKPVGLTASSGFVEQSRTTVQQRRPSGSVSTHPSSSSNAGSRRGSSEQAPQLQRKGSFAMQTLRKLKRTMSLNKGNESSSQAGSAHESRRTSSSSSYSASDVTEDLAVSKRSSTGKFSYLVGLLWNQARQWSNNEFMLKYALR